MRMTNVHGIVFTLWAAFSTSGLTFGQCPPETCTGTPAPATWTIGGVPNSSGVAISPQVGQFPGAIDEDIFLAKAPFSGNECSTQQFVGGNRWAEINLSPCVNYGVQITYNLNTWDHWVPGNPASSDVFGYSGQFRILAPLDQRSLSRPLPPRCLAWHRRATPLRRAEASIQLRF